MGGATHRAIVVDLVPLDPAVVRVGPAARLARHLLRLHELEHVSASVRLHLVALHVQEQRLGVARLGRHDEQVEALRVLRLAFGALLRLNLVLGHGGEV